MHYSVVYCNRISTDSPHSVINIFIWKKLRATCSNVILGLPSFRSKLLLLLWLLERRRVSCFKWQSMTVLTATENIWWKTEIRKEMQGSAMVIAIQLSILIHSSANFERQRLSTAPKKNGIYKLKLNRQIRSIKIPTTSRQNLHVAAMPVQFQTKRQSTPNQLHAPSINISASARAQ